MCSDPRWQQCGFSAWMDPSNPRDDPEAKFRVDHQRHHGAGAWPGLEAVPKKPKFTCFVVIIVQWSKMATVWFQCMNGSNQPMRRPQCQIQRGSSNPPWSWGLTWTWSSPEKAKMHLFCRRHCTTIRDGNNVVSVHEWIQPTHERTPMSNSECVITPTMELGADWDMKQSRKSQKSPFWCDHCATISNCKNMISVHEWIQVHKQVPWTQRRTTRPQGCGLLQPRRNCDQTVDLCCLQNLCIWETHNWEQNETKQHASKQLANGTTKSLHFLNQASMQMFLLQVAFVKMRKQKLENTNKQTKHPPPRHWTCAFVVKRRKTKTRKQSTVELKNWVWLLEHSVFQTMKMMRNNC